MRSAGLGFYEFFAGGGMARLGLGPGWECLFANEFSLKKAASYRANFGESPELLVKDVRQVAPADVPATAVLAWGSFPCQDLSLAGNGMGLTGERSGAFIPFWGLLRSLREQGRGVPIVVIENVVGALTSNRGQDFEMIAQTMARSGYRVGALVMDAIHFLPQSRPRLFIVAVDKDIDIPAALLDQHPSELWHPARLRSVHSQLPECVARNWVWWRLPSPRRRTCALGDLIDTQAEGVHWHSSEQTARLLSLMSPTNALKVAQARSYGKKIIGTVYKRVRVEGDGQKLQRAEVRFDQISGCLRTPVGGSSRQTVLVIHGDSVQSRLLTPREAARLMGLPEAYVLPPNYNDAYHLAGDGVVVPVVQWLGQHLLRPLALSLSSIHVKVA